MTRPCPGWEREARLALSTSNESRYFFSGCTPIFPDLDHGTKELPYQWAFSRIPMIHDDQSTSSDSLQHFVRRPFLEFTSHFYQVCVFHIAAISPKWAACSVADYKPEQAHWSPIKTFLRSGKLRLETSPDNRLVEEIFIAVTTSLSPPWSNRQHLSNQHKTLRKRFPQQSAKKLATSADRTTSSPSNYEAWTTSINYSAWAVAWLVSEGRWQPSTLNDPGAT